MIRRAFLVVFAATAVGLGALPCCTINRGPDALPSGAQYGAARTGHFTPLKEEPADQAPAEE